MRKYWENFVYYCKNTWTAVYLISQICDALHDCGKPPSIDIDCRPRDWQACSRVGISIHTSFSRTPLNIGTLNIPSSPNNIIPQGR
jgi:hypothetical protein